MTADPYRFDHLTTPGSLAQAIKAESLRGAIDHNTCRHCGDAIYLAPYFLDGKLPNPPVWQHRNAAGTTCRTRPKGWRKQSWPHAEPPANESGVPS